MRGIEGRTFVVTGAASGIGRATSQRLADAGANVALLDRDVARAGEVASGLGGGVGGSGGRALAVACDVADEASVVAAVGAARDRFGALHGAVTSAGVFDVADLGDLEHTSVATFDAVLGVNLRGTFLVLKATLPHLGPGSSVVTVASTAGLRGHGVGAAYTASKGGVVALTRLAALQYGPKGIRVNCVCPGATAGEGMGATFADEATAARVSSDLPLRRVGTAEDVGATIAALLGDEAPYVTGQVIAVDGGATIR